MKKFICVIILQAFVLFGFPQTEVHQLLCNNLSNPIGIGVSTPQFSWQLRSNKRNEMQSAYEIRVGSNLSDFKKGKHLDWNSGKILLMNRYT